MRNHILISLALAACSKGDAKPAPDHVPSKPAPAPVPAPKPAEPAVAPASQPAPAKQPKLDPLGTLAAIGARSPGELRIDDERTFVFVTIDPATDKKTKKALCADQTLADKIIARYGGRLASYEPDTVSCEPHGELMWCTFAPQDEHEKELTFAITREEKPTLAGIVERETWMIDPDSARYKADLAERDRELAKAAKACSK